MCGLELPCAPCCSLFCREKRSVLYVGQGMNWIQPGPLLQTCFHRLWVLRKLWTVDISSPNSLYQLKGALQHSLSTVPRTGTQP